MEPVPFNTLFKPTILKTPVGDIEYIDICPERQIDPVPILMAPGWGQSWRTYKALIERIYQTNRRCISLSLYTIKPQDDALSDYPITEVMKLQAVMAVLDATAVEKVDVIAHSEGTFYTTLAATFYSNRFRNFVLISPAGLLANDKPHRLLGRFLYMSVKEGVAFIKNDVERKPLIDAIKTMAKYFSIDPKQRFKELLDISQIDLVRIIKSVRQNDHRVAVLHSEGDILFDSETVRKAAWEEAEVDSFYLLKGSHNSIFLQEGYIDIALGALYDLAHKTQRQEKKVSSIKKAMRFIRQLFHI